MRTTTHAAASTRGARRPSTRTCEKHAPKASSSRSRNLSSIGRRAIAGASMWSDDSATEDVLGVVIVDHGSRRKESNAQLEVFVEQYARVTGRDIVEAAHMELASPSIADAFGRCVERGANVIVVAPFFLSPGRHWQEDIPQLVKEAAAAHSGVRHVVSAPIGLHPLMVEVIDSRMRHCLARAKGEVDACDVCAGSKFGCQML
ncbi:hypothetical protein BE221DRAFT_78412 [Ostreococcus tauri]|uniref:Cobalamin (Vitamin B12) biosynthesis CbiX n=1 Tax=Ostreococcus tauri TaxID=70448 RepID=A0A1Y5I441_OSTTA|nr:hypothetical protein BE221DRAFT_78412 [Ostreococcus tauri]